MLTHFFSLSEYCIIAVIKVDREDIMITSTSNPQIKNLVLLGKKSKARKEQGVFLAEGRKMFEEAPKEQVRNLYVTQDYLFDEKNHAGLDGIKYEVLADHVMKAVCQSQTPQGILAVVSKMEWDIAYRESWCDGSYLLLENIQDPGNLGTMVRTAEAAGFRAVIVSGTTADLYNPKTVRATMGSIYRMPFVVAEDFHEVIRKMKKAGIKIYAAHLKGQNMYDEPDYTKTCGLLIGNEGNGLMKETADLADEYIKIPMEGRAESLNAAVAAAVLMYEVNRQKRR